MQGYQNDQKVVNEGRKETLTSDGTELEVSKRDQICDSLLARLKESRNATGETTIGEHLAHTWYRANADRQNWLKRQEQLLYEYDEFLADIYPKPYEWSSSLHLPVTYTVAKTYHARMYQALMDIDPPFTVTARQSANVDRAKLIQELMRYTLKSWCNENMGVEDAVDRWLWDWITAGVGILKARWWTKYSKYQELVETQVPDIQSKVDPQTGEITYVQGTKTETKEKLVIHKCFDGPMLERVSYEDLIIVGGEGDPQKAEFVAQQQMLTASELWTLVDEGIFVKEAVENVIKAGPRRETSDQTQNIKYERAIQAGTSNPHYNYAVDRYRVIEAYVKLDVFGSGVSSDLIIWFNPETRELFHANYLYRQMPTGLVPFFKIDFYKRNGQQYGIGLVELLYTITKEMDALHNIRVDTGILCSMPFGFYRPTSSMATERLSIEPGALIPLDNPQGDVYFPVLGERTGFGMQEEQSLNAWVERLTSISDMSLGMLGAQGAARTATGARALVGEANANLNIFVRRLNGGWKRALIYLFNLVQKKIPKGFEFRLFGDDGQLYFSQIHDPAELKGMYDFELEGNSANSNKQVQVDTAQQIYQMTGNPIDLQLGLVSPQERFEAIKNLLQQLNVKDWSRFIRKPANVGRQFTPEELANRILAGIPVQLDPSQDLQGFIDYVGYIFQHDELLGQFNEQQAIALEKKRREAVMLLQAMQQQQAQVANVRQQQVNQQMAAPTAGMSTASSTQPSPGPGGQPLPTQPGPAGTSSS